MMFLHEVGSFLLKLVATQIKLNDTFGGGGGFRPLSYLHNILEAICSCAESGKAAPNLVYAVD
jgi:hypothetical protein